MLRKMSSYQLLHINFLVFSFNIYSLRIKEPIVFGHSIYVPSKDLSLWSGILDIYEALICRLHSGSHCPCGIFRYMYKNVTKNLQFGLKVRCQLSNHIRISLSKKCHIYSRSHKKMDTLFPPFSPSNLGQIG